VSDQPDAPRPAPPATRSFLAFDYGTRRVGVASGNTLLRSATPLKTIAAEGDARFAAIEKLVREWQPNALVVGVPNGLFAAGDVGDGRVVEGVAVEVQARQDAVQPAWHPPIPVAG